MDHTVAAGSILSFAAFVADAAQSGQVSAVHLLGIVVALGGGVIAYLVREVTALRTTTDALRVENRELATVLAEVGGMITDPDVRQRVRDEIDEITNRKETRR